MSERARIGFIGLGVMGSRMAGTLARAGHALAVHDVDRAKVGALAAAGGVACASPKEVAQQSDVVISSLPLPATVRSVYLGPDGVLEGARPGAVLVDTSTCWARPSTTRGPPGPATSSSWSTTSCRWATCWSPPRPSCSACGRAWSPSGCSRSSRRAPAARTTSRSASPTSWPGTSRRASVDLARKDLGLAVDMARSHDVPVPATSLLHQLYNACAALGEGQSDFAAIVKLFESWAGTEVKGG